MASQAVHVRFELAALSNLRLCSTGRYLSGRFTIIHGLTGDNQPIRPIAVLMAGHQTAGFCDDLCRQNDSIRVADHIDTGGFTVEQPDKDPGRDRDHQGCG